MALIVEDGTGMTTSESYMTVDEATTYHAARGNGAWTDGGLDEQEAALRRATTWIDITHTLLFIGYRTKGRDQALEWPRTSAYVTWPANGPAPIAGSIPYGYYAGQWNSIPTNEIPYELKKATAEAALREIVTPGVLFPDIQPNQIIKSVSVAGAVSVTYASSSVDQQRTLITIVGALLRPLLDLSAEGGSNFGVGGRAN